MTVPTTVSYGGRRFKRAEVMRQMDAVRAAMAEGRTLDPPCGPRDLALRHATAKYLLRASA